MPRPWIVSLRSLALSAFVDLGTANVHHDLVEAGGMATRVLVPFVLRPGLSLGVGWRI